MSLDEFEQVVHALSAQTLGRVITMVVFVALWPPFIGITWNAVSDYAKASGLGDGLPAVLRCMLSLIDEMHLLQ